MTDPSLDRRVADVLGWKWEKWPPASPDHFTVFDGNSIREPSHRIADAIAALEAMRTKGWKRGTIYFHEDYTVVLNADGWKPYGLGSVSGVAETLPLAICRAIVATEEK